MLANRANEALLRFSISSGIEFQSSTENILNIENKESIGFPKYSGATFLKIAQERIEKINSIVKNPKNTKYDDLIALLTPGKIEFTIGKY